MLGAASAAHLQQLAERTVPSQLRGPLRLLQQAHQRRHQGGIVRHQRLRALGSHLPQHLLRVRRTQRQRRLGTRPPLPPAEE